MKTLQEIETEAILSYVDSLVEAMPRKIRKMFKREQIWFVIGSNDQLELKGDPSLKKEDLEEACCLIFEYLYDHPCPKFEPVVYH